MQYRGKRMRDGFAKDRAPMVHLGHVPSLTLTIHHASNAEAIARYRFYFFSSFGLFPSDFTVRRASSAFEATSTDECNAW